MIFGLCWIRNRFLGACANTSSSSACRAWRLPLEVPTFSRALLTVCLNSLSSGSIKIDASQFSPFFVELRFAHCCFSIFLFDQETEIASSYKRHGPRTDACRTSPGVRQQKRKRQGRTAMAHQRRDKSGSQGPSRPSRQGARLGRVHVHPCCRLEPERLSSKTQSQDAARVRRKTDQASIAFTKVSTSEHAAPVGPNPPAQGRAECGHRRSQGSPAGLW